jgi:hypothetical protein
MVINKVNQVTFLLSQGISLINEREDGVRTCYNHLLSKLAARRHQSRIQIQLLTCEPILSRAPLSLHMVAVHSYGISQVVMPHSVWQLLFLVNIVINVSQTVMNSPSQASFCCFYSPTV